LTTTRQTRTVYVIATAAPPVLELRTLLGMLRDRGWSPCVILSPVAATWIDEGELTAEGWPLRVEPRRPAEQDSLPNADAVLAAPLTFNTLNKWRAGISDTLALGLLNELLGEGVPILGVPCVKTALQRHPAYSESVEVLASTGAHFVDPIRVVRRRTDGLATFDWDEVVRAFERMTSAPRRCSP
jgi:flavoprotein